MLTPIFNILMTVIPFIVLLLILIFVHELGHFIAAKLLGVKVEKFSLGFPPKAWSKTIGETEYQIAWLPLGGYVKMYGEDPNSEEKVSPELQGRSFSHKPPWAKMIIVLAGPIFNIIFAVFLFFILTWFIGFKHIAPIIGPVEPGSPAAEAGLQMDDELLAVNGKPIKYFDELRTVLDESQGQPIKLTVKRQGREMSLTAAPKLEHYKDVFNDTQSSYTIGAGIRTLPVIAGVAADKPAAKAGLKPGDLIVAIDGRSTPDWADVLTAIQGPPENRGSKENLKVKPLDFEVKRDGQNHHFTVVPEQTVSQNSIGETIYTPMVAIEVKTSYLIEKVGFFHAIGNGFRATYNLTKMTLISVQKLLTGQVSSKTLGGPILIAEVTGAQAKAGWEALLSLAAFISINLGILNLLPVPVLDGGQFVFFAIEAIRRKPLNIRMREIGQWIGLALLGALMVMVFYNDISRWITKAKTKTQVEETLPASEAGR